MTKKHPIQAHFEQQEAEERLREEQERQREEAQAEEQRRLDLERQRLKDAWIAVSPAIAEAVARANEALTPYVDERLNRTDFFHLCAITASLATIWVLQCRSFEYVLAADAIGCKLQTSGRWLSST
jgi:hypothetical protein